MLVREKDQVGGWEESCGRGETGWNVNRVDAGATGGGEVG